MQLKRANKQREWLELSTTPAADVKGKGAKRQVGERKKEKREREARERATETRRTVPEPGQKGKTDE